MKKTTITILFTVGMLIYGNTLAADVMDKGAKMIDDGKEIVGDAVDATMDKGADGHDKMAKTEKAMSGTNHKIKMLNKGADGAFVFEPGFLKVAKGDTVTFIATDKSHLVKSELTPSGNSWQGGMNKDFSITLTEEGVVVYSCLPHTGLGMAGIIQVGSATTNLEDAKKVVSTMNVFQNKERLSEYLAQVK